MKVEVRKFLNRKGHHSVAAVYTDFADGYGQLIISDCSRRILLSIDASDRKERANTLYKLNVLLGVIGDLRDAVQEYKP